MRLLTLERVLVASDLEPSSDEAVAGACALARAAGAALTLLYVANSQGGGADDAEIEAALQRAGVDRRDLTVERAVGSPVRAIQAVAERLHADVIVLGPHRAKERRDSALGSTAYGVVAGSRVPCLVLGGPMRLPVERVLAPIDLSDTARGALMVALTWASALRRRGSASELSVLHVGHASERGNAGEERIDLELEAVRRAGGTWAGVRVTPEVEEGEDVAGTIARCAADHDLIVLGTRGLGESAEAIGSVAASLVGQVPAPLLLVPPAVWTEYAKDA